MADCNNSSLLIYTPSEENPWDISKVRFIYRRLGFGISNEKAKALLIKSPEELIEDIINSAQILPLTPAPSGDFGIIVKLIVLEIIKHFIKIHGKNRLFQILFLMDLEKGLHCFGVITL